jgi:hypothetical protein
VIPERENKRGLNLAAVKFTTVQVTNLLLYEELHDSGNDLLCQALTDTGLWEVTPCSLVDMDQHFGRDCCPNFSINQTIWLNIPEDRNLAIKYSVLKLL